MTQLPDQLIARDNEKRRHYGAVAVKIITFPIKVLNHAKIKVLIGLLSYTILKCDEVDALSCQKTCFVNWPHFNVIVISSTLWD